MQQSQLLIDLKQFYSAEFYDAIEEKTAISAELIIPRVMEIVSPGSVLDVGCGRGIWLRAFQSVGVQDILGVDGAHIPEASLRIPPMYFERADLTIPLDIPRRFDLAVCLEVVEHLPEASGRSIVQTITRSAPFVLFSAAIPGQGGRHHVNERWPEYWHKVFASAGFEPFDLIRPHIRGDCRICSWYRQNMLLYVSRDVFLGCERLQEKLSGSRCSSFDWVHADIYRNNYELTLGRAFKSLPNLIWHAVRKRVLSGIRC